MKKLLSILFFLSMLNYCYGQVIPHKKGHFHGNTSGNNHIDYKSSKIKGTEEKRVDLIAKKRELILLRKLYKLKKNKILTKAQMEQLMKIYKYRGGGGGGGGERLRNLIDKLESKIIWSKSEENIVEYNDITLLRLQIMINEINKRIESTEIYYQKMKKFEVGERIGKVTVKIYNSSSDLKRIALGSYSELDTFTIKPNENWLSPYYKTHPIVKIKTNDNTISYQLILGKQYRIIWNKEKKYWDLETL